MTKVEHLLVTKQANEQRESNLLEVRRDLENADELCRSIVEGGLVQLEANGLEAAARFLSFNMYRLLIARRAALAIGIPASQSTPEPELVA